MAPRRRLAPSRSTAALLVVLVAALLVGTAAPASAATTLEVEAGYSGLYQPGRDIPVRVRIESDRLLRGVVRISPGGPFPNQLVVEVPVELAGGSVTELTATVPSQPFFGARLQMSVELRVGDRRIAGADADADPSGDDELVGLLPGALAGRDVPRNAPLAVDAGVARFTAITEADLAAVPASLGPLDVLAATPGDLGDLTPAQLAGVQRWLSTGGELYVDAAPGEDVPGLPAAWRPGADGRATVGGGGVRLTGDAMARGAWTGLVEPTALGMTQNFGFSGEPIEMSLARDAGLRFPKLNLLLALLAFYALGLVPVTAYLLRRAGRGELAWIALPLLAVVCTGIAYGMGRGIRDDSRTVQATVLETGEAPWASSTVAVISRNGGDEEVRYPRGWSAATAGQNFGPNLSATTRVEAGGRELRTVQHLEAGQFALRGARGPIDLDGGLELTATADGDDVVGTIRNTLDFAVERVAVFHDRGAAVVGRLGPGEERRWRVAPAPDAQPFPGPADRIWPEASGMNGRPDPNTVVNLGLWSSYVSTLPSSMLDNGVVLAGGWVRNRRGVGRIDGDRAAGRTLVVGSARVLPGDGVLTGPAVASAMVRSPFDGSAQGPGDPVIQRFTLPAGRHPGRLVLRGPSNIEYAAWAGGRWVDLEAVPGTRAGAGMFNLGPAEDHALPAGAVVGGRVWVRSRLQQMDPTFAMLSPVSIEERA